MRRHELDLTSLVAGVVFVAIAVAYLVGEATDVRVSAGWVLPLGLIGLGLAGLAGTVRRGLRDSRPADVATAPLEAPDDVADPAGDLEQHADDTP
jgi:hypothetical protein